MLQQTVRPKRRTIEEKSVATKEKLCCDKVVKEPKKSCRNKAYKMKRKMLVAINKIILQQFPEAEVYKELGETNFVSRHKAFLPQQEQDSCIKTLSR